PPLFLLDRRMITFGNKLLGQFSLNFLAKSLLSHGTRCLTRPVTRNFGETRKAVSDRIPFFGYFLRGHFNLQRGDRPRLLFNFDLHNLTVTALCKRRKTCPNLAGPERRVTVS